MPCHLLRAIAGVNQQKRLEKLSDRVLVLVAIADSGVFRALGVEPGEIVVVRDKRPSGLSGCRQLIDVV